MKKIIEALKCELENGGRAVLCTVIDNTGACPRGKGAHMLVCEKSKTIGTIGGGQVEYEAELKAKELLISRENALQDYHFYTQIDMVRSGTVTVLFWYMDKTKADFCNRTLSLINKQGDAWVVMRIGSDFELETGFYTHVGGFENINDHDEFTALLKNKPVYIKKRDGSCCYAEPLSLSGQVYLFGGGHVAQAVAPLLHSVGFRYTVFEEREQFALPELFPEAQRIVLGNFADIARDVTITPKDFVLIMARSHENDYALQVQVLKTPACYIGVIGSIEKYKSLCGRLLSDGFSQCDIDRIISPVGLPIKAETPAEIAVSIVAQMIRVRAEKFNEK